MLPKIDIPVYEAVLPLSKMKVNYRPIVVKEEKIILMATQSGEASDMRKTVEQILTNCVVSLNEHIKLDYNKLPLADIEYLLIQIRDKSLGGTQTNEYTCNAVVDEKECGEKFKVNFDFNKLDIIQGDLSKSKIKLNEKLGLKLKPPSYSVINKVAEQTDVFDYDLLADTVEFVYDSTQTYKLAEQTKEEIVEFFDNMPKAKLDEIYDFIEAMPKYEIKSSHTCKKCGTEHKITAVNLSNFFQ